MATEFDNIEISGSITRWLSLKQQGWLRLTQTEWIEFEDIRREIYVELNKNQLEKEGRYKNLPQSFDEIV